MVLYNGGRALRIAIGMIVLVLLLVGEAGAVDSYEFVLKIPHSFQWYFYSLSDIAVDSGRNVYVAESNHIQKFSSSGTFLTKWGSEGSGDGQFNSISGVAVDSSGNVYVVDSGNNRTQKFTSSGTFLTKWGNGGSGDGQFNWPSGVAVDSSGNVYIADTNNDRIQKFTSSGSFLTKWGSYGSGNGQFSSPRGVAVDSSGNVYVSESITNPREPYKNNRIQKFTSSGTFLTKWGSYGSGDGQFSYPEGVAVDSSDNVYVSESGNNSIQKFTSSGNFLAKWGSYGSGDDQFSWPSGVAVDSSGNVYVADTGNDRIQKFTSSGTFLTKWGSYGSGDDQFSWPSGVAVDSGGNVYVADTSNDRIQKFSSSGNFLAKWGSGGSGNGQFSYPGGVAVDSSGNVYVADGNNNRIQKFSSSGNFLAKWGSYGSDDGQFNDPGGVAVDNSGNVYVADGNNNRIQKFSSSGNFLTKWGSYGSGNGQFSYPGGVAVDNSGNVYVADTINDRIQKFSSSGSFLTKWGSYGSGDGQFRGVAVDSNGNVYVADSINALIQKFSSSGSFFTKWGSYGSDDGQFNSPAGLAVDSSGNVYVADTSNQRIQKFRNLEAPPEIITLLFPDKIPEVQIGGTTYQWYKTIPNSKIYIDSNYLDNSQPDDNGIFNVSINTSRLGITTPQNLDVKTYRATLTKNGETVSVDSSMFNFTLNILPRNYSTSWFLGDTLGGGGGIVAYVKGEKALDFTMSNKNQETILSMNRDKSDALTVGVKDGFEAKAPIIGKVDVLSSDINVSTKSIYGSQVNVDYKNAADLQKLEGTLYILTSIVALNPQQIMYEAITAISDQFTQDLTVDYYESGLGVSSGASANIVEINIGPESKSKVKATLAGATLGSGVEVGKSFKTRTYPVKNYNEYITQYVFDMNADLSASLLGNDQSLFGISDSLDASTIVGQGNEGVFGKTKIKQSDEQIGLLEYSNKEINYDYGRITDVNLVNQLINPDLKASTIFHDMIMNENFIKENARTTVSETRGRKLDVQLPLSATVGIYDLELSGGIKLGQANDYTLEKGIFQNSKTYIQEEYRYDSHVNQPTEELSVIIKSLVQPIGNILSNVISSIKKVAVGAGTEVFFATGKLIFNIATQFLSSQNSANNGASLLQIQQVPTINLTISSFAPTRPTTQVQAIFRSAGISSSYVSSISGSYFVIGNITDLQPYNITFEPAAQLILNYTVENVIGINEPDLRIYKWDSQYNAWIPLSSMVNTTSRTVSTNITGFGTFAIGYDKTQPVINWNSTNVSYDGINIDSYITDDGSGVNSSSIRIYLDGVNQNYSFAPFTGHMFANLSTDTGIHTIRIYAEDTSGNSNYTEKEINVLNNSKVIDLNITPSGKNASIILSWTGVSGNYSIEKYEIYRDGELFYNTTKSNITLNVTSSSTFMVIPKDINNNSGIGSAILYQTGELVPRFTYNWNNTLEPSPFEPIIFDASSSYAVNGTFERRIILYEWIFDDDKNNIITGKIVNHKFTNPGYHNVTLEIDDNNQIQGNLTKKLYVTPTTTSIIVNAPNGGENWQAGTTQTIRWNYAGSPGLYVKLELLKGTANSTINSNVSISSNGNGSYDWLINSTQTPGTNYKVRITSTTNPIYNNTSNNNFTISVLPLVRYINGTVLDSVNKSGISGVKVFTNTSKSTTTNATGFYSFNVTSGTYNVTATFEPRYFQNSTTVSTSMSGVVMQNIELLKKPTGNITGIVRIK